MEATNARSRVFKYGTNVVAATLLLLVVLGVVNYLANKSLRRIDLTRDKEYTTSDATKHLLASLKDQVNVTVYATEHDTPPNWTEEREQLRSLLYEYRLHSGGRVNYVFKDPSADEKVKKEAEQTGIQEVQMQQVGTEELKVNLGYLGMVVRYKGKTETYPTIQPNAKLEYQLSRAINKLAEVTIPVIGFLAPQGNPFMGDNGNYAAIPKLLEQEGYTVKKFEATNLRDLKDCKLLMVFEPDELSEEALYRIDQFVMKGGKVLVVASGVQIDNRTRRAQPKAPNVNSLLESYGIRINADLVEDWGHGVRDMAVTQRGELVQITNPLIIQVSDFSESNPMVKRMKQMFMVFASSVSASQAGTSGTLEVIAKTSDRAKRQDQILVTEPSRIKRPEPGEKLDSLNLIMAAKGPLTSRFSVVDPPALTEDNGTTRAVAASEVIRTSPPEAEVIACGSPYSFYDQIVQGNGLPNAVFAVNVADQLTRGGEMIALRSKQALNSVLKTDISPSQKRTAYALGIFGIPVCLVLFGAFIGWMSRMKRQRYRDIYEAA